MMSFLSKLFGSGSSELEATVAHSRLNGKTGPLVLDVREPHEFAYGHIEGARLIPLGDLAQRMKELPRDREIICVCRSGHRSRKATRQLKADGLKVSNLRGGMLAWSRAGLPVKQGKK